MNSGTVLAGNDGLTTKNKRTTGDARDRHGIADEIVTELVVQCRGDCILRTAGQERVTVWRRVRDCLSANSAASAAPIFGHEWLAEPFRQVLSDETRDDVTRAAGGKTDDDVDRPARVGRRFGNARQRRDYRGPCRQTKKSSAGKNHC